MNPSDFGFRPFLRVLTSHAIPLKLGSWLGSYLCPLPTIYWMEAGLAEKEAFAQRDHLSEAAPDDLVARGRVCATADVAAESSDQANGNTEMVGWGQLFFLA